MIAKKPAVRSRQLKRQEKPSAASSPDFEREVPPYTYEPVADLRYVRQVPALSLANAPVLG